MRKEKNSFFKFPLFVDLKGKKAVVVGGGNIAVRRINVLLQFGAYVVVVSDCFKDYNIIGGVEFIERKFRDEDIDGAFIVIAATNDRIVNSHVGELCKQKNIFVSVADSAEESTFFFPAICKSDKICVGVVSKGNQHRIVRSVSEKIRGIICGKN